MDKHLSKLYKVKYAENSLHKTEVKEEKLEECRQSMSGRANYDINSFQKLCKEKAENKFQIKTLQNDIVELGI